MIQFYSALKVTLLLRFNTKKQFNNYDYDSKKTDYNIALNDIKMDPILDHIQIDHWDLNKYANAK